MRGEAPQVSSWPGNVAVAVTQDEQAQFLLAENGDVLSRLVALRWVAQTHPSVLGGRLEGIRTALLEERWGDAVFQWMEATGTIVDAYPDEEGWTEERLDQDRASFEIRMAPIFE
jgi:hypothetical protein